MTELFKEWKAKLQPSEQAAHEFEQSMLDFVEMHGDLPAAEVTVDDLLDYRDEAAKLPRSMPRADRALPFSRRTAKYADTDATRISTATLKKRVGAIQAFLALAFARSGSRPMSVSASRSKVMRAVRHASATGEQRL